MGDDNMCEATAMGGDMIRDAAEYEAAATLASLISAPISSDSEEMTCNAPPPAPSLNNETKKRVDKYVISHDNNANAGTRKFTRDDDVNLIRGILKYGKSSWKKIWQETPELQHIKHAALKDRGRSRRFQNALKWAFEDPTLLDRPHELLGDVHSSWYEKGAGNWSKHDFNETGGAKPLFMCGPLQDGKKPIMGSMTKDLHSLPSDTASTMKKAAAVSFTDSRATTKKTAAVVKTEGSNKRPLPDMRGEAVTKKKKKKKESNCGIVTTGTRAATMKTTAVISSTNTRGASKKKAAAVKHEGNDKKASKLRKSTASVPKKNNKGLRTLHNCEADEFPGWTCEVIQRKKSNYYDRCWRHPGLVGVNVRSRVGMREMMEKMETNRVDANTAYEMLMSEGKRKYFLGTGSKP